MGLGGTVGEARAIADPQGGALRYKRVQPWRLGDGGLTGSEWQSWCDGVGGDVQRECIVVAGARHPSPF